MYKFSAKPTTLTNANPTLTHVHRLSSGRGRSDRSDVLVDNEVTDALALPRGRPTAELVVALLLHALVRLQVVAQHLGAVRGDHARVDVRAGAEVVEDTGGDRGADEI